MAEVVWKYPLLKDGNFVTEIKVPGEPLHVGFDPNGELCVWTLVDPRNQEPSAWVFVVGTGEELPEGEWDYLNTFFSEPFVFHAFTEALIIEGGAFS